ncbi:hypothetical protein CVIRNUC_000205 [Coccomyxa viridis]|uniref:Uncharacterized protein n=1 Tax=Coccomyxa viridis TaxID=1274662 RepID=A0AAV1HR37_9CHLO|nr:hypothetical protein CVIRNUC_000205 [Coccomyxa viridis]
MKGSALKCSWARRKAQASGGGGTPAASLASHANVGLVGLPAQKYVGIQQQPAMQLDDYCQRYQSWLGSTLGISQPAQFMVPPHQEHRLLTLDHLENRLAFYDIPICLEAMEIH